MGLSLKYKVMILLTIVPLLLLGSYLFLVIQVFESDKIAYIYDTNASVNRSIASQTRGVFISILSSVKPVLQEYFANGEMGTLSREIFFGDKNLLLIAELKNENGRIKLFQHFEKEKDYVNDLIKDLTHLNILLNQVNSENRLVRTPFSNKSILLIESVQNPIDNKIVHFAIIFQSPELVDLFSETQNRFYLATESGEILFQSLLNKSENKTIQLLNNDFFKKVQSKRAAEGTELIKNKKNPFLASYNKTGFANLIVTSLVDQKKALSAIKILITKSLLFAGLLLSFALLISIFSSQTITQALQNLTLATQRISQGDFTSRVNITTKDEIGSLANSFNLMSKEVGRLLSETAEKARMEGELQTARTVQETLFPPHVQNYGPIQIAGHYEPASECGGDWWYYSKIDNKILLCIGDATGHGAPAALITSAARSSASILEKLNLPPHQIMQFLNSAIYDVSKGRVMMTFFLGIIDLEKSTFSYSNASHDPPYLVKSKNSEQAIKKKDLIPLMDVNNARLGQDASTQYNETTFPIENDDFILFYTDGISDVRDPNGQALGEREFIKLILGNISHRLHPEVFVQNMCSQIEDFRMQTDLVDDVTFFCIKYGRAS